MPFAHAYLRKGHPTVELTITRHSEEGHPVVVPVGELDVYTARLLRDEIDESAPAGTERVVVDLRGITFMDSTAMGVLVGRMRLLRRTGGDVVVVADNDRVLRVFAMTGLDTVFAMGATIPEALAAEGSPAAPDEE